MFCYVYIKKQEKQQDVLIKALDVFLICPVVFKKGADVLKFPVVKCEHIRMYRLKDISCCSRKIYNLIRGEKRCVSKFGRSENI